MKHLRALLVNPFMYDVSAYSFWSSPLGLLYVGSLLREKGVEVELIDCLTVEEAKRKEDGTGPFVKERVPTPAVARPLRRRFRRYGMSKDDLRERLAGTRPPDLVLVTSIMTYWYLGTIEVVDLIREVFPETRIVVGGIYTSLCKDHAKRNLGAADLIVGSGELPAFFGFLGETFGRSFHETAGEGGALCAPYPAFDLYGTIPFVPVLTGTGCSYRCTYCATPYLHPEVRRRRPADVVEEVGYWHGRGVDRFVLYDDNFLYRREEHGKVILRGLGGLAGAVSFYNPNALNAALMDEETALLLKEAGFKEVRLGFETADPHGQRDTGGKVDGGSFERAVGFLKAAGFAAGQIGVYVLTGLPFQKAVDVRHSIEYLAGLDVRIHLAAYTPIPHTPLFEQFHLRARYPIADEPLFQNNALFPFAWEGFTEEELNELKAQVREINAKTVTSERGTILN